MNYYNEFDPAAAAWLRELIDRKLIPPGVVDERSICDVDADDLRGFVQCHFFAGIGGWSLALKLAGWPDERPVWTGSCPCQSFSAAGKQSGFADERDLWPVFAGLIRAARPERVFGEQVEAAIRFGWLDRVYSDMEAESYSVRAAVLGAHSVGAPHRRYRLYWGLRRLAQNADGGGRGGRNNGDSSGNNRKIQNERLCPACGVAECDEKQLYGGGNVGKSGRQEFANGSRDSGMADSPIDRSAAGLSEQDKRKSGIARKPIDDSLQNISPWRNSRFIYCRDGKIRRIPSKSLLFGLADGVPDGVDGGGACGISEDGGFPLTAQKEGRAMLLKGYGNAIVPQVAAAFIQASETVENASDHA